jgi:tRNA pseudouridine13 synthase
VQEGAQDGAVGAIGAEGAADALQGLQLVLSFTLPPGNYATSLLSELLTTQEPERLTEGDGEPVVFE